MPLLGKILKSLTKGNDIHLLIYHCLDVAALQIAGGINQSYCKILFAEMNAIKTEGEGLAVIFHCSS